MLIRPADLARIRDGEVDLAFRRWERPRLRVGTLMRTSIGSVTSVEQVDDVPEADARRAGDSRERLLSLMQKKEPAPIREHPARRTPDLAELVGRDTQPFKRDVRKLKELGLTESLEIGYRLSPRGEALVSQW